MFENAWTYNRPSCHVYR
ncbi:hypothetical protein B4U79_07961 [Dinothrombium tinctorium]|uniref:Uncharacterized protein n=1 Tax=Dinothrombium tinctorium TaxID=1965070 RepID=A0A443QS14_9ACAR|nr:hypothetical protein B4U79_07961 [Dinothrombium tinctorium]